MKNGKVFSMIILILNSIGVLLLLFYGVPLLTHDTTVMNPDAMLPFEEWDRAGMMLTVLFFPLTIVDTLWFLMEKARHRAVRAFCFAPSVLCLILVLVYLLSALAQ